MASRKPTREKNFLLFISQKELQLSSDVLASWSSAQQPQKCSSSCQVMQPETSVTNPQNIINGKASKVTPTLHLTQPVYLWHSGAGPLTHIPPSDLVSTVAGDGELQLHSLLPLWSACRRLLNQLKRFRLCWRGAAAWSTAGTSASLRWRRQGGGACLFALTPGWLKLRGGHRLSGNVKW